MTGQDLVRIFIYLSSNIWTLIIPHGLACLVVPGCASQCSVEFSLEAVGTEQKTFVFNCFHT